MVGLLKPTSQEAKIQSAGNQASDAARFNPSTPPSVGHTVSTYPGDLTSVGPNRKAGFDLYQSS